MDAAKLAQLKLFVQQCEANPAVLGEPSLRFFRNYLDKLGAKLPAAAYGKAETGKSSPFADNQVEESDDDMPELEEQDAPGKTRPAKSWNDSEEESDLELDNEYVVPPDNEPLEKMPDPTVEVTEEKRDSAQIAKGKAMEAMAEGNLDEALHYLTEAIVCNPSSAILYANRAGVYVKMKKPNAAIRDAEAAIKINPDSAKGYKSRGQAKALLGLWEEAAKDLHLASRLDYDEEIAAVLKMVEPNVHKIEEHRRKYERLRKERDERRIAHEREKAAQENARKEQEKYVPPAGTAGRGKPSGFPGGMPGFPGGMPAGMGGGGGFPGSVPGMAPGGIDMSKILSDPEMMAAFSDPEVMAALQDVMKNPSNLSKHQGNPKVAPVIAKMFSKFAGGAGTF